LPPTSDPFGGAMFFLAGFTLAIVDTPFGGRTSIADDDDLFRLDPSVVLDARQHVRYQDGRRR
jgi:hypothetical protein